MTIDKLKNASFLLLIAGFIGCLPACSKDKESDPEARRVGSLKDIDGNQYKTVKIGEQWWMAENLRVLRLNDGQAISGGLTAEDWFAANQAAYAIYDPTEIEDLNTSKEVMDAYGVHYNWRVVETGKICPTGWRVPSEADWNELVETVGGNVYAAMELTSTRSNATPHPRWDGLFTGLGVPDDTFGFSALPSGSIEDHMASMGLGTKSAWWKTDGNAQNGAIAHWVEIMQDYWFQSFGYGSYTAACKGHTIRCIRE